MTFLASQKIHLKDIGRGNMGIKLLPTPRVCFFDTMSWKEARPRTKPYAWTGLWKLASEYVSTSYDTLNTIRTRHNQDWKGMFGAFAAHCKSYHPVLKEMGVMRTDGAMQGF